ncbi:type I-E CRISPR-associated protein Cse1/CasA [Streptomyces sp. NPDC058287]|uniref:type I-E CRISPR-associated protein Cse1/CasA n=1 Tax=Streptomyces sp. NPDC058287 TaxID=3346423 RepID=UPI0036E52160
MVFDLRDEPWIPVRLAGASARVGLRTLFQRAHEIADLELPVPPAASGLLRILAALTARIARDGEVPLDDVKRADDIDGWFALRAKVLTRRKFDPEAVDDYFDQEELAERFDLFGAERPFLQDPRLCTECVDAPRGTQSVRCEQAGAWTSHRCQRGCVVRALHRRGSSAHPGR